MADSTGRELTYGEVLTGRRAAWQDWIRRHCRRAEMVGVLLPLHRRRSPGQHRPHPAPERVPVNLNFTAGPEAMAIRHRAMRHPHRHHFEAPSSPKPSSSPCTAWSTSKTSWHVRQALRQTARAARRALRPRRAALAADTARPIPSPPSSSPAAAPASPRASCSRTTT